MKLSELLCSVIKFNKEKEVFIDIINIKDSPWVNYLETKNTERLYESFYATQNYPDHPNNYWYNIKNLIN